MLAANHSNRLMFIYYGRINKVVLLSHLLFIAAHIYTFLVNRHDKCVKVLHRDAASTMDPFVSFSTEGANLAKEENVVQASSILI